MPGELVNRKSLLQDDGENVGCDPRMYPERNVQPRQENGNIIPGTEAIASGIFSAILVALFKKKTWGMGQCSSTNKGMKDLFSVDLVHSAEQIQGREEKPPVRENISHMEKDKPISLVKACLEVR